MSSNMTSRIRWGLIAALSLLTVVALSACALPGAAAAKPSPSPDPQAQMLKFAECMRANGVTDFPDPSTSAGGGTDIHFKAGSGVDPKDPAFQKAEAACSKYLSGSLGRGTKPDKATQAQMLKFSQCMRAHGVPNFPDPSAEGGIALDPSSGADPNDPSFQKAQQACSSIIGNPKTQTNSGGGPGMSTSSSGK
jgi:hypothetical protein